MAETAYDIVTMHGKPIDRATADALRLVEADLGYELTIVQGIGNAAASAGTHKGRAVDLAPWDYERKVKALKRRGFAVWYRAALPGVWGPHIHAVLMLNAFDNAKGMAAAAFRQIGSFLRGRDGLAADRPDPQPWRADPQPVFRWPVKEKPVRPARTNVTRARDRVVEAHAALEQAAALLDDADPTRVKARGQRDEIRAAARQAEAILQRLPKR